MGVAKEAIDLKKWATRATWAIVVAVLFGSIIHDHTEQAATPDGPSYNQLLTDREDAMIVGGHVLNFSELAIGSRFLDETSATSMQRDTESSLQSPLSKHTLAAAACIDLAVNGSQPPPDALDNYKHGLSASNAVTADDYFQQAAASCLHGLAAYLSDLPPSRLIVVSVIEGPNNNN